jgi:protein O-mannosyl-transferase
LSKSVTATLPAALLVVAWWQQGKLSWKHDVRPLAPWLALGGASGLFTAWVERAYIGAQGDAFGLSLLQRGLIAGREIWFYLGKLLWPANLIFIYPHWTVRAGELVWWMPAVGVIGVLGLLVMLEFKVAAARLRPAGYAAAISARGRGNRALLAAFLFFVGTLFPTLGFFNVYAFIFSYVADHWAYLASLGVIAPLVAATVLALRGAPSWSRKAGSAVGAAVVAVLGLLTWRQCRAYHDAETFYRTILERNPAAWMAHDYLGVVLDRTGRLPEAMPHFEEALRLNPSYAKTYNDYGGALAEMGRLPEAIAACAHALQLSPDYGAAHNSLGNVLASAGRLPEAIGHFERAIALIPDYAEARANLGLALTLDGRPAEGIAQLEAAVRLKPDFAAAHASLGFALAQAGRLPEAIAEFGRALRLEPDDAEVRHNLALALRASGRFEEAAAQFDQAERLRNQRR